MVRVSGLVLAAAVAAQSAATQTPATVEEPSSHVPFPVEITAPGGMERHVLAGTGIRTKTILRVKVYAFGIYVQPELARQRLAQFAGTSARDLQRNEAFYQSVLEMQIPITLRLVMTRNVGGDDMADAFDGALRPRVRAAAERGMTGGEAALDRFRTFFDVERLTRDSELLFSCYPEGRLATVVRGEPSPDIQSRALCWALFDVYLGESPISGGGKRTVIERIPEILQGN